MTKRRLSAPPSEHNEQAAFFDAIHFRHLREHPEIHPLFFSVPNGMPLLSGTGGGPQRYAIINRMKSEGLTPGVADTLFLSGRGGYFGLAMEFKTVNKAGTKNGGLSENQQEFLSALSAEGYLATVAYGAEHAENIVEKYLETPRTQDMIYQALRCLENNKADDARKILEDVVKAWA